MGELRAALDESIAGRGGLAMLVGEPGIGKTRTAQELASYAEGRGAQVLWGRCYEEEGAPPYWPWVQAIRDYVQLAEPDRIRVEMGPGAADIAVIVPNVGVKLTDLPTPPDLEPEQARFRLFDSIATFFKNSARSQPLVLVLDDLHWADESSLLLLRFMAQQLQDSCILVVGCYRDVELSRQHPLSDTLAQLSREQGFQRHLLRGLNREETGQLVEGTAGIRPGPTVVDTVFDHTDGNPYFMTEVVRLLASQGELEESGATGSQGLRIPEGVREVIGRRLNRLSSDCNRVLTTASVIGREFRLNQLTPLLDALSEDQMLEALEEALEARLIEEMPQAPGRYQFAHRLAQETLLQELSLTRRVRLHARIAVMLEELYGEGAESRAGELAYHFAQAETVTGTEKIVRYSLLAGEQALAAYAFQEALTYFESALAAKEDQPTDADTAALYFGLFRAQAATRARQVGYEEPVENQRRAFDYYFQAGDADAAVAVAQFSINPPPGIDLGRTNLMSLALTLVATDSLDAGFLLAEFGACLFRESSDYEGAKEAFAQALVIAEREQDLLLEMRTQFFANEIDMWNLQWQDVPERGRRVIELAQLLDDPRTEALASFEMIKVLAAIGEIAEAQRISESMLAAAEKLRDVSSLVFSFWTNGTLCRSVGDWEDASAFLERGLEVGRSGPLLLSDLLVVDHQTGDLDQGKAHVVQIQDNPASGFS